jgi:HSP20 family protein
MTMTRWFHGSPFAELNTLHNDLDRFFGAFRQGQAERAGVYPALDVYDDGECLIVRAELPGVDAKSLDVTVTGDTLVLRGERPAPPANERGSYHRQERDYGRFQRALTLPEPVNSAKVVAQYRDGVLELRLPRAESAKPRKIQIDA